MLPTRPFILLCLATYLCILFWFIKENPSPFRPRARPPADVLSSPLTPPPHDDDLFALWPEPQSPRRSSQKSRAKCILAYVAVPHLPEGVRKVDYEISGERGKRKLDEKAQAERIGRNPIFEALHAGLRHNGADHNGTHIQTFVSRKAKGKARARSVTPSDEEKDWEDAYGTIFVTRPKKRKVKDEDDRSYGSPPRKKKYIRRPNAIASAASSPHVPLSQVVPEAKRMTKRPKPKTKQGDRDLLVLDIRDVRDLPPELLPTTRATFSSIRHLRGAYEVDGGREKMWEARCDVGDEYPTSTYAVDKISRSSSSRQQKMKGKSRVSLHAQTTPPSNAHPGSLSDDANDASRRPMLARKDRSNATSPVTIKGKARLQTQAFGTLSPSPRPKSTHPPTSVGIEAKDTMSPLNDPTHNITLDEGVISTDADAEGEVDMEYFLHDMESHPAATGGGTALPDRCVEKGHENEPNSGRLVPTATMFSPAASGRLSSINMYSSEGHLHANQSRPHGIDNTRRDAGHFLSDSGGVGNGDDAFYSNPTDFSSSPWLSGGEGDFQHQSTLNGAAESLATDAWNGTIDPSLLGGGDVAEPQTLSPSPSPLSSSIRGAAETSSHQPTKLYTPFGNPSLPRRRIPRPRLRDNFVDTEQLDLSGSESDSSSDTTGQSDDVSDSECESDAGDTDTDTDSVSPPVALTTRNPGGSTSTLTSTSRDSPKSVPDPPPAAPKRIARKKPNRPPPVTKQSPALTWCHQCRRNTLHEKMKCSNKRPDGDKCQYRFCIICVEKR